jgi:hypothetical protein
MALTARHAVAQTDSVSVATTQPHRWSSFLPLMGDLARERGIELPLPLGAGRLLPPEPRHPVDDVRIGRNGAPPTSVSQFAQLSSNSNVDNLNVKLDAWLLPFVNLYAIVGYVWNTSDTRIDVALPPLLPGGSDRQATVVVPTKLEGSVAGLGMTLAGGYGPYFMTYDLNVDQADLGFDDRFKAVVTSIRAGWNGRAGKKPLRLWASATDWNTAATATVTVTDSDGGSLHFEVDQGPVYRYTYGIGAMSSLNPHLDLAIDGGSDFHGGWYLAVVPVFRF